MPDLEGIVKLRGRWVKLEDIQNPKLARVLHKRLKKDRFAFGHSEGYQEVKGDRVRKHTDEHSDSYDDSHRDNHRDHTDGSHHDNWGYEDYEHTDRGYSESHHSGHSDHTDHY